MLAFETIFAYLNSPVLNTFRFIYSMFPNFQILDFLAERRTIFVCTRYV